MPYNLTVRVHEMGEDTFVDEEYPSLAEALIEMSHRINEYCLHDETCIEWHLVDTTGSPATHEVQWTCEETFTQGDEHVVSNCDYIMQITES